MKRYVTYKPSGVEWLGEIPEHWEIKRMKDITTKVGDGLHGTPNYTDDSTFYFINGNNLQNGIIDFKNTRTISQDVFNEIKISFNSQTLFLSINGTIGNLSFYNNEKIAIGKSIAYIIFKSGFNKNFLFYHMLTDNILDSFEIELSGTTIKNLSLKTLRETFLINPTFSEQTTISKYLDDKTSAIDSKIELLTTKANKYKALRRSLINETVCRGLNTKVPQKDSGIEWLGRIPEHWEVKRFKEIASTVKGRNLDFSDTYFENSLPNLSLEYLRNESINFDTYCYTTDKNQRVTSDDMIIIWDGAGVGEILKGKDGYLSSTIAKIVVKKKKYDSDFLFHLRFSIEYILKMIPAGMGIPHLNPQVLNSFSCPCPPLNEQKEIAQYLNEKTTQIDTILNNISEQMNKLTQLRKILINDVVTGKIKVTED